MIWMARDFSKVVPGATVQHSHTQRYGQVLEEPDADNVKTHLGTWPLRMLQHRNIGNAIAIFGKPGGCQTT